MFLCQRYFLFTPRQVTQLLYSRFVNTRGLPHHNIPCDLYMEHLNRTVKTALGPQSGHWQPNSITRAGRIVGCLERAMEKFDELTSLEGTSGAHKRTSDVASIKKLVSLLCSTAVFSNRRQHHHPSFPNISCNHLLSNIDTCKVFEWICVHASIIIVLS